MVTKFCMSCGNEEKHSAKNCSCCNASFDEIKIEPAKIINRAAQVGLKNQDTLSIPLGEQIDFSAFESLAADLEKEAAGLSESPKGLTFQDILNEKR